MGDNPPTREAAMVVIERDETGAPTVWCDPEIADIVRALNAGGIPTVASCSGHGHRPGNIALADGRELLIVPDFEVGRSLDRLLPGTDGRAPVVVVEALQDARAAKGQEQVFYRTGKFIGIAKALLPTPTQEATRG